MNYLYQGACLHQCGAWTYRYSLTRIWNDMGPKVLCIGLNPSTADAHKDDRTITNLVALLDRYGYGELCMMNLFALVSKDPQVLRMCPDPVKDNDEHLRKESVNAKAVIFCWGSFPIAAYRAKVVTQMFPDAVCF